jgi:hypothetical protein
MDDLYETNFQSNGEFYKICILYNNIDHLSMVVGKTLVNVVYSNIRKQKKIVIQNKNEV